MVTIALALAACSAGDVPFPQGELSSTTIELSTGGDAQSYSVELHGDGQAEFDGRGTLVEDPILYRVEPLQIAGLVDRFRQARFFGLRSMYALEGLMDGSSTLLSISIGGQQKRVLDYAGAEAGMPQVVTDLQASVARVAEVERWVTGNAETVPSLKKIGFDFRSRQAGLILMRAAGGDAPEVAFAMLREGAPAATMPDYGPLTPVSQAAGRGRLNLVRALIQAGGLSTAPRDVVNFALGAAASSGNVAIAREILAYKPDLTSRAFNDAPPLHAALNAKPCKTISRNCDNAAMVRLLVVAGADPNARSGSGFPALLDAKDAFTVRALLQAGFDPNTDDSGQPILWSASNEDVALELIAAGADITRRGHEGSLQLIAERRAWHRIQRLLAMQSSDPRKAAGALIRP